MDQRSSEGLEHSGFAESGHSIECLLHGNMSVRSFAGGSGIRRN